MLRHPTIALVVAASLFVLVACGDEGDTEEVSATTGFPMTVENCGRDVTLTEPPNRVVLLGDSAIPLLAATDALDRVVARAGEFPAQLYDEATRAAVEAIPTFGAGEETDGSGTVQVSLEAVIDQRPDLVIGYEPEGSGITAEALETAGIPLLVIPAFCTDPAEVPPDPGFDDVYEAVKFYGRLFGSKNTDQTVDELRDRVAAVQQAVAATPPRTAATLFVYSDGTPPSAYGTASISHAQMQTAGLTNVFGDIDARNVEVSFEEVISRDPDVIILLYVGAPDDQERIKEELLAFPGARELTAVRNDDVAVLPFQLTDPPTPLSVDGLEIIATQLGGVS